MVHMIGWLSDWLQHQMNYGRDVIHVGPVGNSGSAGAVAASGVSTIPCIDCYWKNLRPSFNISRTLTGAGALL